jgi:hypothetical protein
MGSGERDRTEAVSEESNVARSSTEVDKSGGDGPSEGVGNALDIENALSEVPGTDADIDETEATGKVIEARKLPSDAVPDTYPVAIDSADAVGLRVLITADRETMVYLAWPDTYDQSADLACLLNDLGISPDRFADIIGAEIGLVVVDGQWVPEVAVESARPHPASGTDQMPAMPDEAGDSEVVMNDGTVAVVREGNGTRLVNADRVSGTSSVPQRQERKRTVEPVPKDDPDTNPDYYYGVVGIGGLWTAFLLDWFAGIHLMPTGVAVLLLLGSPVVFPFLIYRDAEHVAANSEWSPHIAWTIGSVFWIVNTFVFLGYIYNRRRAMSTERVQ